MDTKLEYYEVIACDVCKINDPQKLFSKCREGEVPFARQMCMYYRRSNLLMTLADAGYRYKKDHATVLHAKKKIKEIEEIHDLYGKESIRHNQWIKFKDSCKTELNRRQHQKYLVTLNKKIQKIGFRRFMADHARVLLNAYLALDAYNNNEDDANGEVRVFESIDVVDGSIKELKEIFSYENS